jgi:adenylate kinase family enzyme
MRTCVINLFAGPGVGKSTMAADLFAAMKKSGYEVEMVREWVKLWAWEGKKMNLQDQIMVFANQLHEETSLYGKVNYLITDSPFILSPFYEDVNYHSTHTLSAAKAIMFEAEQNNVSYLNFFIDRTRAYKKAGRFQSEKKAKWLDKRLKDFLLENQIEFEIISNKEDILLELLQ